MKKDNLFNHIDKGLLVLMIINLIFGLVMLLSASSMHSLYTYGNMYTIFIKQLVFVVISLIGYGVIITLNTKIYYKTYKLILGTVILLLIWVRFFTKGVRGVHAWINIAGFTIQPSEFAKLAVVIFMAIYYEKYYKQCKDDYRKLFIPLILAMITVGLILIEPDFGGATIVSAITYFTFISIPFNTKLTEILKYVGIGAIIVVAIMLYSGILNNVLTKTQRERLEFNDVCTKEKYTTSGLQLCNGYIAFNTGGWFGLGIGGSKQKYLYLPEPQNDFIFAVVGEELGVVGCLVVLLFLFSLILRVFYVGSKATKLSHNIMCYGIGTFILVQTLVNIGGVTGSIPLTGVPLPFYSSGGSFIITLICSLGIVSRISIETSVYNKKKRREIRL